MHSRYQILHTGYHVYIEQQSFNIRVCAKTNFLHTSYRYWPQKLLHMLSHRGMLHTGYHFHIEQQGYIMRVCVRKYVVNILPADKLSTLTEKVSNIHASSWKNLTDFANKLPFSYQAARFHHTRMRISRNIFLHKSFPNICVFSKRKDFTYRFRYMLPFHVERQGSIIRVCVYKLSTLTRNVVNIPIEILTYVLLHTEIPSM